MKDEEKDDEIDLSLIGQLKDFAEHEGFDRDTEGFERRLRQLKVIKCREIRGVYSCSSCMAYDDCDLIKQVMRENAGIK